MADISNCNGNSVYLPSLSSCDECSALRSELDAVEDALNDKVDKVSGKGLSTNDFTNAEKDKLAFIETGAEKNRTYTAFTGKPTGNQTPSFGGTFTIQQIKQSTTGQVSGTDRTVKIPATTATTTAAGLMSATDKSNLESLLTRVAALEALIGNKQDTVISMTDENNNTKSVTVLAE